MRVALKFAYLGQEFHGYARQPGLRTVEGDILRAMAHLGIASGAKAHRFQSASRTDAGVSALGNVAAVDTGFRVSGICRALNSCLEGIWFWGVARVEATFRPQAARERWYRYHLPGGLDLRTLQEASTLFVGTHDLRGFTRAKERTVRCITAATVTDNPPFTLLDLRAPAFAWNQVRRIAAALLKCGRGEASPEDVRQTLADGRPRFGLAPAEPLVLMDIRYDFPFRVEVDRPSLIAWIEALHRARVREAFLGHLVERASESHRWLRLA